ncbi:S41 family peptidase [Hyphobacterium sp. SN044]|uniref:S41 family peptidase n=1 Tax=Hyphobacterium sp. SN044 TaxID=2912575 RepID=UPI001F44180B|nr:S41 family peptidase [Hyphobacterium sp. SN044]
MSFLIPALVLALQSGPQPIFTDGVADPAAQGVWRSADYGWIIEIEEDSLIRWQDTPAGCYRTPDAPTARLMGQIEYRLFTREGDTIGLQYLDGDSNTRFERLPHLPERCGAEDLDTPSGVFEVFASAMQAHYAFFDQRGIDWPARVEAARPLVRSDMSDAELFDVLAGLMNGLSDSHTKLTALIDGEERLVQDGLGTTLPRMRETTGEQPWLIGLVDQLLEGGVLTEPEFVGNGRIITGRVTTGDDRRVGYVLIFTMGGFTEDFAPGTLEWAEAERRIFSEIMNTAMERFAEYDAVIVDLSNNRGGYDAIARAVASHFTASPFLAYTQHPGTNPAAAEAHRIEPADRVFTGPVGVLTSDVTVSGGEIATLSLRQLPNVLHAGTSTRGAFSTPLAKPLPNGWYLELSNEVFAAPDGTVYEETGITPDLEFDVYPVDAPVTGHADAVRQLAEALTR